MDFAGKKQRLQEGLVKNLKFLGADGTILTAGRSGKVPPGQLNGTSTGTAETSQYFFHPDHLGSTSYITDASGEVYQHLEYIAFGETFVEEHSNTDRTPYLFNGKELDEETGLYYFGARYYDPRTSIWQSVDPLAEEMPAWSAYNYTFDNPVRYIDPDGMAPDDPGGPGTKLIEFGKGVGTGLYNYGKSTLQGLGTLASLNNPVTGPIIASQMYEGGKYAVNNPGKVASAVGSAVKGQYNKLQYGSVREQGEVIGGVLGVVFETALGAEVARAGSGAKGVTSVATNEARAFRYVAEGEVNAIKETGLLRGGRPGETFYTKDVYKSGSKAQKRLALPNTPTHRVEFEILNNPTLQRNGTKVEPLFNQLGKGSEFMTTDPVKVKFLNSQPLGR